MTIRKLLIGHAHAYVFYLLWSHYLLHMTQWIVNHLLSNIESSNHHLKIRLQLKKEKEKNRDDGRKT